MDPWEWSVDDVVTNLCNSRQLWANRPNTNLPQPATLEETIRENELDGSSLLSDVSLETLKTDFGIKPFSHRSALIYAIDKLRNESQGYRSHQVTISARDKHIADLAGAATTAAPTISTPQSHFQEATTLTHHEPQGTILQGSQAWQVTAAPKLSPFEAPESTPAKARPGEILVESSYGGTKRRKVLVDTTQPLTATSRKKQPKADHPLVPESRSAYLGRTKLTASDVIYGSAELGMAPHPELGSDDDSDLDILGSTKRVVPGRKVFVSRRIYHMMRAEPEEVGQGKMKLIPYPEKLAKGRLPALLVSMVAPGKPEVTKQDALFAEYAKPDMRNQSPTDGTTDNAQWDYLVDKYQTNDDDPELPVYGESDDEGISAGGSFAASLEENSDDEERPVKDLPVEITTAIIDREIIRFEQDWKNRILPSFESKARSIWFKGRRRDFSIEGVNRMLAHKNEYLGKLKQRILADHWRREIHVTKQCEVMEITVHNVSELQWKLHLWQQPRPPPPKSRVAKIERKRQVAQESDDGIELSSDPNETSDFIEDDEEKGLYARTRLAYDSKSKHAPQASSQEPYNDATIQDVDSVLDAESPAPVMYPLDKFNSAQSSKDSVLDTSSEELHPAREMMTSERIPKDTEIIDLTGLDSSPPPDPLQTPQKLQKMSIPSKSPSVLQQTPVSASSSQYQLAKWAKDPRLATREEIDEWDIEDLEQRTDRKRLILKLLIEMELDQFALLKDEFFRLMKLGAFKQKFELSRGMGEMKSQMGQLFGLSESEYQGLLALSRLFVCWMDSNSTHMDATTRGIKAIDKTLKHIKSNYNDFRELLSAALSDDGAAARESDIEDAQLQAQGTPRKKKKRRKRKILRSGQDLRESALQRRVAGDEGATRIKVQLESSGLREEDAGIVINATKDEGQQFIFIEKGISSQMKPHQIEGVRFLWREVVVAGHDGPSGCLLAHTMGLGKTMQSIALILTLVTAMGETGFAEQIPAQLRPTGDLQFPRVLILCPPGLISNWMEELGKWIPDNHPLSSSINCITSSLNLSERFFQVNLWYEYGGVLVAGYEMLRDILHGRGMTEEKRASVQNPSYEETVQRLTTGAHLVVADEAHKFKDASSGIGQAMAKLEAHSRIAMTGSPLANNLGEYYAMINWVAPDYLGNPKEFKWHFQKPIEEGTYADSSRYEQRRSMKKLQAFKEEVEPKVNRKDITALRRDLKPKTEFVLRFELTKLQFDAYITFVRSLQDKPDGDVSNTRMFDWMNVLTLLLYHPSVFLQKLINREARRYVKVKRDQRMKAKSPSSDDSNDVDVDASKMDLSQSMLEQQQQLFKNLPAEFPHSAPLSPKTRFIERILVSAKIAREQVLIFSHSRPVLDHLQFWLSVSHPEFRLSRLDGSTAMNDRLKLAKAFNAGQYDVMLISTRAGGLGLNLPGASRVILADFSFNPSWEEQAVGRAYRLGQQRPVFVYHLLCGGTFEDSLHHRTVFKKQLSHRAVDKKNSKPVANKMRDFLYEPVEQEQLDLRPFQDLDEILDDILDSDEDSRIRSITTMDIFNQAEEELNAQELEEVRKELEQWRKREFAYGAMSDAAASLHGAHISRPVMAAPLVPAMSSDLSTTNAGLAAAPQTLMSPGKSSDMTLPAPQAQMSTGAASGVAPAAPQQNTISTPGAADSTR